MTSSHAEYVDARQSSFNQTGRDWNQNTTNYYISFSLFGPQHQQTTGRVPNINDDLPRPISNRATSCHIVAPYRSSHTISTIDSAVKLIIQITDQLIDRRDSSNNYRELQSELKYLHQTLMLTRLAIQEYDGRPLGPGLANAITPEVVRCCIVLQEMLGSIVATCQGLSLTSINYLWRPVWQKRWDGEELAALRDKLSGSRKLFEEFLMGLHSYVLLVSYAWPFTKAPWHFTKCCLARTRKRILRWSCIPPQVSLFIYSASTFPGAHQIKCSARSEPLGGHHTNPKHVLFHLEGTLYSVLCWLTSTSLQARISTTLSKVIVGIAWEVTSSNRVTTKSYALKITK